MDLLNGNQVSTWIAAAGIWPLVVMLVPNLMFRRYGQAAGRKRMASLFQAIAVFVVTTMAAFIVEKNLTDLYLWIAAAVVIVVLYVFRGKVFPYSLKCVECGASLDFKTIYFMDDNACPACHDRLKAAEEAEEGDGSEPAGITDEADDSDEEDGEGGEAASEEDE